MGKIKQPWGAPQWAPKVLEILEILLLKLNKIKYEKSETSVFFYFKYSHIDQNAILKKNFFFKKIPKFRDFLKKNSKF